MKGFLIFAVMAFCISICHAQVQVQGKIFGKDNQGETNILPGASVMWIGTSKGVSSNESGSFSINSDGVLDKRLIFSFAGYHTDTIKWEGQAYLSVTLDPKDNSLEIVEVNYRRPGIYSSVLSVGKTEIIGMKELSKAACCDLAGCFGTQASVQAHPTNAVTNAQELRLLGMSGVYNQVLFEGMPMIQGLSYTYGISTYPGTLVEAIHISKGSTSVLQGFESISGQINVQGRNPASAEKLYLNAYVNNFQEKHLNANLSWSAGKKKYWHSLLALHTVQPAKRVDRNNDGFLDLPLLRRYMAYNKWEYNTGRETGLTAQMGWRIVHENRLGGQVGFRSPSDRGSTSVYGQSIRFSQPEIFFKSGYRFDERNAIQASLSGFYHDQQSWFGTLKYKATQASAQFNVQHEWKWQDRNLLKYGLSYRYQELDENIMMLDPSDTRTYGGDYLTRLRVPGIFAENTFETEDKKWSLMTGIRADRHQKYGWYATPRALAKFVINENHTFRASGGTGWRQVNLFSEQINLLSSSRNLIFEEELKPEKATTWGVSHTWNFWLGSANVVLSGDFYQTLFRNQFFPDYDSDPTKAFIRNFSGNSRSNGVQLEGSVQLVSGFELRTAYNYLDVYQIQQGEKFILPFNSKNRIMGALSYATPNEKWQFDANAHWYDRMRLPNTQPNPEPYRRPSVSEPYTTVNLQATAKMRQFEVYGGCENIGNYRQANPIIGADNPFGPYFDISSVWGPIRGREFYLGLRYRIK
ncbi:MULTISPECIES: TonB-dependent receptor [Sphingobacterium]|uniref:TonB-dependent receptor n=1 Tax=Sphingobacterium cellulitidis TaxID=1768011 RepID=A0A8H9FYD7_9SPHI|nr:MULTISPECIES: TonB-dependent receptor [Sphingobacterium]MBA8986326.1 outer membrane receptor for ferrienterochelin and colicin [Sphingobacterium soli]WGQ12815.1 TonB-dependent receptor [Sphingobacterium faecium]GGE19305.1 TonB-dependent receptor [Sphingobacterium soli]